MGKSTDRFICRGLPGWLSVRARVLWVNGKQNPLRQKLPNGADEHRAAGAGETGNGLPATITELAAPDLHRGVYGWAREEQRH